MCLKVNPETLGSKGQQWQPRLTLHWLKVSVLPRWVERIVRGPTGPDPWGRSAWWGPWTRKSETIFPNSSTCWRSRPFSRFDAFFLGRGCVFVICFANQSVSQQKLITVGARSLQARCCSCNVRAPLFLSLKEMFVSEAQMVFCHPVGL